MDVTTLRDSARAGQATRGITVKEFVRKAPGDTTAKRNVTVTRMNHASQEMGSVIAHQEKWANLVKKCVHRVHLD